MRRKQKGSVFIIALALIVILTMVIVSVTASTKVEANALQNKLTIRRAQRMAESGIVEALSTLKDQDPNILSNNDDWTLLGQNGNENVIVGGESFRIQVLDAGSFVNVNTASEEQLQKLPITQEQVDALLDWRTADGNARTNGGKDEYYNQLTTPYNAKLKELSTVNELLLVRNFDAHTLFDVPDTTTTSNLSSGSTSSEKPLVDLVTVDSTSPNVDPSGNQRQNINTAQVNGLIQLGFLPQTANAIIQRRNQVGTFTQMAQVLQTPGLTNQNAQQLLDNFTVNAEATDKGKININTASVEVLRTIPNVTEDVVQSILTRQGSFGSIGELATLNGVNIVTLQILADLVTVGSNTFVVRTMGIAAGRRAFLQAIVRVENGEAKIVRIETPAFSDMDVRWGWESETTQDRVLVESQ